MNRLVEALREARRWLGDGDLADGMHRDIWTPRYAAAIDMIDAAIAAHDAQPRQEPTFWLIECRNGFTGWWDGRERVDCRFFDKDPNKAHRFATQADAEKVINERGHSCMIATGHLWIAPAQSQQEPTYEQLWNAMQRIDTAACAMPTFHVTHDGGFEAVVQNIIDAVVAQPQQERTERAERERFEAWAETDTPFGTQRNDEGFYQSSWLQQQWAAWQAALAAH